MILRTAVITVLALGYAQASYAQTFPADEAYVPLYCNDVAMSDLVADEPGAINERDIVGNGDEPAGLHASDTDYLYVRMRLDSDPTDANGDLRPFGWGFELDTDGDATTYEVLILANGNLQTITLHSNETTTLPNDPTDPPDTPEVASYNFADNGQAAAAASDFGGDADRFLDLAIAWDDLAEVGVTPLTTVSVWAASSSDGQVLNADFACHDGATGDPQLDDIVSDSTTADPDENGGGGGGGGGNGDTELAGGGGCAAGGQPGRAGLWLCALALIVLRRRRSQG